MAHLIYEREDLLLQLARHADGRVTARARVADGSSVQLEWVPCSDAEAAVSGADLVEFVLARLPLPEPPYVEDGRLRRFVIETSDAELAALDWDDGLRRRAGPWMPPLLRALPVQFIERRALLRLPLRVLECDPPAGGGDLRSMVSQVFGSQQNRREPLAVTVAAVDRAQLGRASAEEMACDILHLWQASANPAALHDTTDPELAGSLGWALALAQRSGCQLLALHAAADGEAMTLRELAHAVLARGGPAVVVFAGPQAPAAVAAFYANLVHDFPLDRAASECPPPGAALFAGGGREEALRVSRQGAALFETAPALIAATRALRAFGSIDGGHLLPSLRLPGLPDERQLQALDRFCQAWPTLRFEHHEGEGVLPLVDMLHQVSERSAPGDSNPRWQRRQQQQQQQQQQQWQQQQQVDNWSQPPTPSPPRYVNLALLAGGGDRPLVAVPQREARLNLGEVVQLRVYIGKPDTAVVAMGLPSAPQQQMQQQQQQMPEQVFDWAGGEPGAWIEVAVTGLDFEVLGDPVRRLWLPRPTDNETADDTEAVFFAVRPQRLLASRLRVCVYHQQNLVQSYRLAAIVVDPQVAVADNATLRAELVAALELSPLQREKMPQVGYLSRLEYGLVGSTGRGQGRPARRLSLFVNDHRGDRVITVKGEDTFGVEQVGDADADVDDLRSLLRALSTKDTATGPDYVFQIGGQPNQGDADLLRKSLLRLADQGWRLYSKLFPGVRQRARMAEKLAEPGVIHVAHLLVEQVLPWAALYDRYYDSGQDPSGAPAVQEACIDILDEPADKLLTMRCGEHPKCLLHASRQQARNGPPIGDEHVACPLHFWGFRHVVELPVQQADEDGVAPMQQDEVVATGKLNVAAGVNEELGLVKEHLEALRRIHTGRPLDISSKSRRDEVLALLARADLDLVYFYCHARGGEVDGQHQTERLEFKSAGDPAPGTIEASQFKPVAWTHHPLVFINGCHTAGFSARALSPFVRSFRGQDAAGVIGTEIDVWEPLAADFARRFFEQFLAGANVGDAMRNTRLQLLALHNPLGLVYTLYAPAQLQLCLT